MPEAVEDLIIRLSDEDREKREVAGASLGDWLASTARAGRDFDPVARALIRALLTEDDHDVQEEIANSLGYLVEYGKITRELVQPLLMHQTHLDPRVAAHVADLIDASTWPS